MSGVPSSAQKEANKKLPSLNFIAERERENKEFLYYQVSNFLPNNREEYNKEAYAKRLQVIQGLAESGIINSSHEYKIYTPLEDVEDPDGSRAPFKSSNLLIISSHRDALLIHFIFSREIILKPGDGQLEKLRKEANEKLDAYHEVGVEKMLTQGWVSSVPPSQAVEITKKEAGFNAIAMTKDNIHLLFQAIVTEEKKILHHAPQSDIGKLRLEILNHIKAIANDISNSKGFPGQLNKRQVKIRDLWTLNGKLAEAASQEEKSITDAKTYVQNLLAQPNKPEKERDRNYDPNLFKQAFWRRSEDHTLTLFKRADAALKKLAEQPQSDDKPDDSASVASAIKPPELH